MNTAHIILAVAWILYCVLHSVLAASNVKSWMQEKLRDNYKYYRFAYTLFSFIGLVVLLIYQVSIPSPAIFNSGFGMQLTGAALAATGTALMLLNIFKYFMQLSGVRWLYSTNAESKLERKGFHRYVRHPLYFSTFLFIWSLWLVYPYLSLLIMNVVITAYTLIALRFEEKKLLIEFGEEYRNYQQEVPMILPRMVRRRTEES